MHSSACPSSHQLAGADRTPVKNRQQEHVLLQTILTQASDSGSRAKKLGQELHETHGVLLGWRWLSAGPCTGTAEELAPAPARQHEGSGAGTL